MMYNATIRKIPHLLYNVYLNFISLILSNEIFADNVNINLEVIINLYSKALLMLRKFPIFLDKISRKFPFR